jgi:two-component system NtrC family sensor kinase
MRLAPKLALAFLLVVGGVFVANTWIGMRWHARLYQADSMRDLERIGRGLAIAAEVVWRDHGQAQALALVDETNARADETLVRWVPLRGGDDGPEAPPERLAALRNGGSVAWLDAEGGRLYTYVGLSVEPGAPGVLELSESLEPGEEWLRTRALLHAGSGLLMILLSALASLLLGERFVARPVRALVEQARRIGEGDFGAQLVLPGRDEFADLAREMNAMAARLDGARRRIDDETAARLSAVEQLRHADRLSTAGKLASGIAHELGTPLHVISERARMIASGEAREPAEARACAEVIHQQASRMTHIVRQLLDLARRRQPETGATDLVGLVRSTLALLAPLAEARGVGLALAPPAAPVTAEVDPGQIQQALTNLVLNALDATPASGRVTVSVAADGGAARIQVADEGPGIEEDRLRHVFDPFFTTKPVGAGTGLGLSIAEGIAHEHGGCIEVHSVPGAGSRFAIRVPIGGVA